MLASACYPSRRKNATDFTDGSKKNPEIDQETLTQFSRRTADNSSAVMVTNPDDSSIRRVGREAPSMVRLRSLNDVAMYNVYDP